MKVLLINTCGANGVVALAEREEVIAEEWLPGRGASESLLVVLRGLLDGKHWMVRDLGAVGVVIGPGSFTGVRVGLSAAKGLCEAGGVGMVAMSRLALVGGGDEMGVLDAGRGEYYCGSGTRIERLVDVDEIGRLSLDSPLVSCEQNVVKRLEMPVRLVREPGGAEMLEMLRRRVAAGEWSDVAAADANYLRRTDAELLVKAKSERGGGCDDITAGR